MNQRVKTHGPWAQANIFGPQSGIFYISKILVRSVLDLPKSCKDSTESTHISLIQLLMLVTSCITFISIIHVSQLRNSHQYQLSTKHTVFRCYETFPHAPFLFLDSIQDTTIHLAIVSLHAPLRYDAFSNFSFLMTLTILGNICQIFCRISLSLGLPDVFLLVRQGLCVLERKTTGVK